MPERATIFGRTAPIYERFRPAYPAAVATEIVAYAGHPLRTALEIGAGTGKATRVLAPHLDRITATDPDAAMLAELRRHVTAETRQASLEELATGTTYDLVYAAAALHWTSPEHRWSRIAALLEPDGIFVSFGGPIRLADDDLAAAVRAARQPWLVDDDVPPPDGTPEGSALRWPGTELERSPLFTDVRQQTIEHRLTMTAGDYVGLLSTVSAYLLLSESDRRAALDSIAGVLPDTVDVRADVELHLARRTR